MRRIIAELLIVGTIGAVLLAVASLAAPIQVEQLQGILEYRENYNYERTFLTIAATLILLLPTFWLFVLQRREGPSSLWRAFWSFSLLAFFVHLYWAIRLLLEVRQEPSWSLPTILTAIVHSPRLVHSPYFDFLILGWWMIDVAISWLPRINGVAQRPPVSLGIAMPIVEPRLDRTNQLVRIERGLIMLLLFVTVVVRTLLLGHGLVRTLGYLTVVTGIVAFAVRIIRRPYYPESVTALAMVRGFGLLNRFFVWHELPTWLAVINLGAIREVLRAYNLHGTEGIPVSQAAGQSAGPGPLQPEDLYQRRDDGCFNDLEHPGMGRSSATTDPSGDLMLHTQSDPGARFGRNIPLTDAHPDLTRLTIPNPRVISDRLLARKEFIPAKTLNLLAAAWIQFQTHDWFNHGEPLEHQVLNVPLPDGQTWPGSKIAGYMQVRRTRPDPTRDYANESRTENNPPTYVNAETHWWDASQIYGSTPAAEKLLRTNSATGTIESNGRLFLLNGQLPLDPSDPDGIALSGFVGNWWVGLSLLHNLFVKEHNAICDMLRVAYPAWDGDRVFRTAKIINAALITKIHTVEWTPAILQHPALQIGMSANWWGLATEGITRYLGRISPGEAFSGIPNSGVDHHGTHFSLTEEFVSVYRLHPLVPDVLEVRQLKDPTALDKVDMLNGVVGPESKLTVFQKYAHTDIWYSFGRQHPGAVTLHNYPNFLRNLTRDSALETNLATGKRRILQETIDLATIDILRDRERGVPRYNEFRRLFHMRPIKSFDDIENPLHPNLSQELRDVYGQTNGKDNVDLLDLMVGMFAETPPEGFGFSDTAFRLFILMASRRLKSDRFIAAGFTADVFTHEGVEWVNGNSMCSVITRHVPELAAALYGAENAFVPWRQLG